jgi:hypothetical protein
MKKINFLMVAAISFLLLSCDKEDSADVNQDKIYTVFEMFYNENSDKTVAICRLRFGGPTGTLLEATGEANVKFNGDIMPYSALYSGHAKEYAGVITTGTFVYTNVEGAVFSNSVSSINNIAFPTEFTTITKSSANTLTWVGNALNANERADFFVGTPVWGQDALFFATGQGSTNIVMGVNQLAGLAEGNATCILDRVKETPVTQGTSEGGVVRSRYRALNKQIQILP